MYAIVRVGRGWTLQGVRYRRAEERRDLSRIAPDVRRPPRPSAIRASVESPAERGGVLGAERGLI